ncbi:hypothetical protein BH11PSE10_BH11PSE10_14690 [soil metagenome]
MAESETRPTEAPLDHLRNVLHGQPGASRQWHLNDLRNHHRRYLADLQQLAALRPAGPILEVGSAPCHMTALLKLSGHAAIGIDLKPERVAGLIAQLGLDVRRCDIEREPLPFDDEAFACVLLCETFEHLRIDPAFVLSEIHRVLAPGAVLLLSTPNVYSLPSLARFLLGRSVADPSEEYGKLRSIGHMGHVREYSAREVARFLRGSGFSVESVAYRSHAHGGGRRERLLRLCYAVAPRRFRREFVIVARRTAPGPGLAPLVPLLPRLPAAAG